MSYKLLTLLMTALWGVMTLPLPNKANANTPLVRAVIQDLHNFVQLMPRQKPKRQARKADAMNPGDGLSTGRSSLAELLFNDGSLARVGERAVFNFLPKTRNFRLQNGTVLLLIPPGRGRTNIRTPSAAAAIHGSALFVRYDQNTKRTIVGALTNSGIEVFNKDASKKQVLKAGQMMVLENGLFKGLYEFDLRTFYRTSDLVKDLELDKPNSVVIPDPALASVREETVAAIKAQPVIEGPGVIDNPSFVVLTDKTTSEPTNEANNDESESDEDSSIITTTTNNWATDVLEASEAASESSKNGVESNSLPNQSSEQQGNQGQGNQGQDNQGQDNQGQDNQGQDNQGQDNQGQDNQGQDNQGQDNQGQDNQGQDNQGQDNQGQDNQGQDNQGQDNQGQDNQGQDDQDQRPST